MIVNIEKYRFSFEDDPFNTEMLRRVQGDISVITHDKLFNHKDGYFVIAFDGDFNHYPPAIIEHFVNHLALELTSCPEYLVQANSVEVTCHKVTSVTCSYNYNVSPEEQVRIAQETKR